MEEYILSQHQIERIRLGMLLQKVIHIKPARIR